MRALIIDGRRCNEYFAVERAATQPAAMNALETAPVPSPKIAITGGTGFVGGHLTRALTAAGVPVVLLSRGQDHRSPDLCRLPGATLAPVGLDDVGKLTRAFTGCTAVAHCAGINREIGRQTYEAVHVKGTRNVVEAARRAGVRHIALLSFLRARPACGSGYHESKFAAEEIVRRSGLAHTILKPGVIYGRGDHMLDHLSHAFHTFPLFALVGMREQPVAPVAVEDVVAILVAALVEGRLENRTLEVIGPEIMTLGEAVRRVASTVEKSPLYFRMPIWFHQALALVCEQVMHVPLVAGAQVRILAEGVVEALPRGVATELPADLRPRISFTREQIRKGLPPPGAFGTSDIRWGRLALAAIPLLLLAGFAAGCGMRSRIRR